MSFIKYQTWEEYYASKQDYYLDQNNVADCDEQLKFGKYGECKVYGMSKIGHYAVSNEERDLGVFVFGEDYSVGAAECEIEQCIYPNGYRTVADILREVGADKGEAFDVFEVSNDENLPRTFEQFVEAYNNAKDFYATDTVPGSLSKPVFGFFVLREVNYEEYDRFFCDGTAPADLAESFPRIMIAVFGQEEI